MPPRSPLSYSCCTISTMMAWSERGTGQALFRAAVIMSFIYRASGPGPNPPEPGLVSFAHRPEFYHGINDEDQILGHSLVRPRLEGPQHGASCQQWDELRRNRCAWYQAWYGKSNRLSLGKD